eukprot:g19398.t1
MRGSLPAPAPCPSIGFSFSIDYRYDAVVWNFPYPIEWTKHNIELKCQELLYKFFVSAKKMIDDEGQIRIALIRGQYERWFIAHHAALAGLGLEQMIPFKKEDHKYYLNRYGDKREQTRDTRSSYIDKDPHYYVFRTTDYSSKKCIVRRIFSIEVHIEDLSA